MLTHCNAFLNFHKNKYCTLQGGPLAGSSKQIVKKESRGAGDVTNKEYNADSRTITVAPGQAFLGDNRSSSGLGLGDGLTSHTSKWLQVCTMTLKDVTEIVLQASSKYDADPTCLTREQNAVSV